MGYRMPPAPPGANEHEIATRKRLWEDVAAANVYTPAMRSAFDLLATTLALAHSPEAASMAPTARVRLLQVAAGLMTEFGLTPKSSRKAEKAPKPRDPRFDEYFD